MTSDDTQEHREEEEENSPLKRLLGEALAAPPRRAGTLLPKIQERIYVRTRGRYFRPRRAHLRDPATLTLLVALALALMLLASFLVFHALTDASETPKAPRATETGEETPAQK